MADKILLNKIKPEDDTKAIWRKIKYNIEEAQGERNAIANTNHYNKKKTPWFCEEGKLLAQKKRDTYIKY